MLKGYDRWKTSCPPDYCDRCGCTVPDGEGTLVEDPDEKEQFLCHECDRESRDDFEGKD